MKPRLFLAITLAAICGGGLSAQMLGPQTTGAMPAAPASENASAAVATNPASTHLTAVQLDQLLGPIALYPDALIALILPSATQPSDVVLAARYLSDGGGDAVIDDQPWDDSIKALAHYPDVVKWMDQNLAWTKQLGDAFLDQPAEVMKAVQRLRTAARAAGTLVDTPQQQVVTEADAISIVPTQPDVIYVPYYDPQIVYLPRRSYGYYPGSFFSFSIGYPVGFWLGYNLDWGHRRIVVIDRHDRERYWHEQRDWRRPSFNSSVAWNSGSHSTFHAWQPNPTVVRVSRPDFRRAAPIVVQPVPFHRDSIPFPHDTVPFPHDPGRQPVTQWNGADHSDRTDRNDHGDRTDRSSGNRDSSRHTSNTPAGNSTASVPTNNFQPATAPASVQVRPSVSTPSVSSASQAPAVYSRGGRVGAPTDQNTREAREGRSGGWSGQNDGGGARHQNDSSHQSSPVVRASAPAPAPASSAPAPTAAAAPSRDNSQSSSHSHRSEPAASAPAPAARSDSTAADSTNDDRPRRTFSRGSSRSE